MTSRMVSFLESRISAQSDKTRVWWCMRPRQDPASINDNFCWFCFAFFFSLSSFLSFFLCFQTWLHLPSSFPSSLTEHEEKLDSLSAEKIRLESCLSRLPSATRMTGKFSSGIVSRQVREILSTRLLPHLWALRRLYKIDWLNDNFVDWLNNHL